MRMIQAWWLTLLAILAYPVTGAKHGGPSGSKQRHHQQVSRVSSNDTPPRSPEYYGLRSNSDLYEPPPNLVESPNVNLDPRPQDINSTVLRRRLGRLFDPVYMSTHRPLRFNDSIDYDFPFRVNRRGKLVARDPDELPAWLRQVKFRQIWLPDGTKARTNGDGVSGARLERKLQTFLWAHTSCPVVYRWRDLGRRFWPRWVREGHCPPGKQSCSVPPGMYCRPDGAVYKNILRWHCKDSQMGRDCHWITIYYPITNKCSCKCLATEN